MPQTNSTTGSAYDKLIPEGISSQYRQGADGIRLHTLEGGEGPLVIFLHGFPECSISWRNQLAHLKDRYRVVAPDLRGYHRSDKPSGVAAYTLDRLCADVAALIPQFGVERAIIVAHDWGGAIAWAFAALYPQLVEKLVILNAPHPIEHGRHIMRDSNQLRMSYYIFMFQVPFFPEWYLTRNQSVQLRKAFPAMAVNRKVFTPEVLDAQVEALSTPGCVTAALNYYRAGGKSFLWELLGSRQADLPKITAPTLVIWGKQDKALSLQVTETFPNLVSGPYRIEFIEQSGHWVQQEQPERVNELLDGFLA